jgi:hypothetical protein
MQVALTGVCSIDSAVVSGFVKFNFFQHSVIRPFPLVMKIRQKHRKRNSEVLCEFLC